LKVLLLSSWVCLVLSLRSWRSSGSIS